MIGSFSLFPSGVYRGSSGRPKTKPIPTNRFNLTTAPSRPRLSLHSCSILTALRQLSSVYSCSGGCKANLPIYLLRMRFCVPSPALCVRSRTVSGVKKRTDKPYTASHHADQLPPLGRDRTAAKQINERYPSESNGTSSLRPVRLLAAT